MNLAILHYHLNRGGVTRVIENQLASLDAVLDANEPWRVAVLFGGRREGFSEDLPQRLKSVRLSLCEVPLLDYDDMQDSDVQGGGVGHGPENLAGDLTAALEELDFAPAKTVLHVHNHGLGKNRHLPPAISQLAEAGYAVLLQIHDFAEDFRPSNYRQIDRPASEVLYPQTPGIHYAVLNGRDHDILREAGADPERLHLLPNPVPRMTDLPSRSEARDRLQQQFGIAPQTRFVLYPVRCIRRKNVGEVLLYSALAGPETVFGLTLPPLNPAEVPIYESWKRQAAELDLPCRFETGAPGGLSFAENLSAADLILTTSLAEGFGMVFLEAWLAGRPLLGRDLPEITGDFTDLGIRFDWLRPRLQVPVEWIGIHAFQRTVLEAYHRTLKAYGREEPQDLAAELNAKTDAGLVDFGDLDETLQQQVLRIVCGSHASRRRLRQCNPWLEPALSIGREDVSASVSETIGRNARIIDGHFSRVPSGRRLLDLYQQVGASPRGGRPGRLPHGERILDRFLTLSRFRVIRS